MENAPEEEAEQLILSAEEAYFLAFGLGENSNTALSLRMKACPIVEITRSRGPRSPAGILSVRTEADQNLCLDELYAKFESTDALFPIRYVAYHHFRQKGWVVRSGMTMGADYLLYKDGPPFTHASFIVSVQTDEDDPEPQTPREFLK